MNLSKLDVRLDPFNANLIHTAHKLVIRSSGEDAQKRHSVGYIPHQFSSFQVFLSLKHTKLFIP